jgi:iron(III) transport system permease protein
VSGRARRPPIALAAAAVGVVALALLPIAYLVLRAADDRFIDIVTEARTWRLVANTVLLALGVVAASLVVAVPTAFLVTRTDLPGRRIWGAAAGLPLVIPSYVAALALLGMAGERGILADALGTDRLPDITGYPGALIALTLSTHPYVYPLCAAALRGVDPSLAEAARGLGVSPVRRFLRVTVPTIRPAAGLGSLLVALYVLSDFGVVSLMRYDTLTQAIFLQYRSLFDRTPAAVLGLVLVALTVVAVVAEQRLRGRGRLSRSGPGAQRQAPAIPLGRWRIAAIAWCATVAGAFCVMPLAALLVWLVRGITNDRTLAIPWSQAADSLTASGLAAVSAVLAALPIALLAQRYPSRPAAVLQRTAYMGNALPGIAIALSLVFFAANYLPALYQTLALLVFAYVVRFLPQALAGAESAIARVDPRLEEASRGLGRGGLETLRRVTIPLARPGLVAGGALVFLSAMKELPATLLLRPIGFDTLATEIWKQTQVAAYSRAAVPALLLIGLSAPILWLAARDTRIENAAAG